MYDFHLQFSALQSLIHKRLSAYFSPPETDAKEESAPPIPDSQFPIPDLSLPEYYILLLALAPHLQPGILDSAVQEFLPNGGEFPEFGGVKSGNHRGMMPTGETALFILAGNDWEERFKVQQLFSEDHFFLKQRILWLEEVKEGEPRMSGRILLSSEWLDQWLFGKSAKPKFSTEFPAKCIETLMTWDDLVLHTQTSRQIDIIASWVAHNQELMLDKRLAPKLKPGYRVLFYGPPGTGKTLTASLIGKQFGKDVYRIDLSQIVSKFIGETEKNLERVFLKAENKDCILFFDEADALFGKRTGVQSSHDKYANQEVSYLLQRVEDFAGLLILASNFKTNIDAAFLRRFHQIIHFPAPDAAERLLLWKKALPENMVLHSETNLPQLAQKYELTGASIINVIQYVCLRAISRKDYLLHPDDFLEAIRREFQKEEKYIS